MFPEPVIRFSRTGRHAIVLVDFSGFPPVEAEVVCKINGSPFVGRIDRDSDWFMITVRLPQSVYADDKHNVAVHVLGMRTAGRIIRFKNIFAERQFPATRRPLGIGTDCNDGIFSLTIDHAPGESGKAILHFENDRAKAINLSAGRTKYRVKLPEIVSPYSSSAEVMIEIEGGGFCPGNRASVSLPSKIVATGVQARFKARDGRGLALIALDHPPKNVPAVVKYKLNGKAHEHVIDPGSRWFVQEVKEEYAEIEVLEISGDVFAKPVAGQKFSFGSAGKDRRTLAIPERQVFHLPACIEAARSAAQGQANLIAATARLFSPALFEEDEEYAGIFEGLGDFAIARKNAKCPKVNLWLVDHSA